MKKSLRILKGNFCDGKEKYYMYKIAVLPGDGIGIEVTQQGVKILKTIGKKYGIDIKMEEGFMGGCAYDKFGTSLPDETLKLCQSCDAILFGANGGPKWDILPSEQRPERALAILRKELGLFANLRPVKIRKPLFGAIPLKPEVLGNGMEIMIVRELTGGIYYGLPKERNDQRAVDSMIYTKPEVLGNGMEIMIVRELTGGIYYGLPKERNDQRAVDSMVYTKPEVERIAKVAFELARKRTKKLASVDKENMLECSKLWREVVINVSNDYPDVQLRHVLVDNCAYQIIAAPGQFDVMVAGNIFGDILSDELGALAGSLGMCPSASLSFKGPALYEPIHGTAPDIAGKGIANPIGSILSVAMMFEYSFNMEKAAKDIELAVDKVLDKGFRTADIKEKDKKTIGTEEMGDMIVREIEYMN